MFKAVNDHITSKEISKLNCVGFCKNGVTSLTGHKKGFQDEVRQDAPHANFIHCIIHSFSIK
jgi:hypothetical protein